MQNCVLNFWSNKHNYQSRLLFSLFGDYKRLARLNILSSSGSCLVPTQGMTVGYHFAHFWLVTKPSRFVIELCRCVSKSATFKIHINFVNRMHSVFIRMYVFEVLMPIIILQARTKLRAEQSGKQYKHSYMYLS